MAGAEQVALEVLDALVDGGRFGDVVAHQHLDVGQRRSVVGSAAVAFLRHLQRCGDDGVRQAHHGTARRRMDRHLFDHFDPALDLLGEASAQHQPRQPAEDHVLASAALPS